MLTRMWWKLTIVLGAAGVSVTVAADEFCFDTPQDLSPGGAPVFADIIDANDWRSSS